MLGKTRRQSAGARRLGGTVGGYYAYTKSSPEDASNSTAGLPNHPPDLESPDETEQMMNSGDVP
jgi:hypothetical protein